MSKLKFRKPAFSSKRSIELLQEKIEYAPAKDSFDGKPSGHLLNDEFGQWEETKILPEQDLNTDETNNIKR